MMLRKATSTTTTDSQISTGLAILRAMVGTIMIAHGAQKVFDVGLAGVTEGFIQFGVPFAVVTAPLVSLLELVGGVLLVLGAFTRLVGITLAVVMLGAAFLVHLPAGFFLPNGYEFALLLASALLALVIMGAGRYSVDHALTSRR